MDTMQNSEGKPMPWYWLVAKDQRHNNYIFWQDTTRIVIRETYQHLVCAGCRKIDEDEALSLGIEPDVRIRARSDFVATNDGIICVREKFRTVLRENQISGLGFTPLPDGNYFLVRPECWLEVDMAKAGFQYDGEPCRICGRYGKGVYVGPLKESYELPTNDKLICTPAALPESCISRILWILASAKTKKILINNGITGIDYSIPL